MPHGQLGRDDSHHSGLVMTESTTVPGGGLDSWPLKSANIRLLILFFTTTTVNLGLWGEMSLKGRGGEGRGGEGRGGEGRRDETRRDETERWGRQGEGGQGRLRRKGRGGQREEGKEETRGYSVACTNERWR